MVISCLDQCAVAVENVEGIQIKLEVEDPLLDTRSCCLYPSYAAAYRVPCLPCPPLRKPAQRRLYEFRGRLT